VPIRVRLAAAIAAAMALVLVLAGLYTYGRVRTELDDALDEAVKVRAESIAALVRAGGGELATVGPEDPDETFVQVLSADGRIVVSSPGVRAGSVASDAELERAQGDAVALEGRSVPALDAPARLYAQPVNAGGRRLVVVAGASTEDRDDTLRVLSRAFVVGGPIALVVVFVLGLALAAVGLRPVEAMRRRAAAIGPDRHGERLPLPPAHDELRRLGETLNAMLARLESAVERERAFVADASHELRTPLSVLKAELEVAGDPRRTGDELRAAVRSAGEEVDVLATLAEDLLVAARLEDGRLAVAAEDVELAPLLGHVRARFAARADAAGRAIEVECPAGLVAFADPVRLGQAVGNLVDNALRHGSGTVRVVAARADEGGGVELRVADDGAGFPEAFAPHAFERFTRADPARGRGGAGLGLAIVAAIARAHGGSARIDGGPGPAGVVVRLPAASHR
jgi:signal transduction histidine kinase